jgi:hypothetical protein
MAQPQRSHGRPHRQLPHTSPSTRSRLLLRLRQPSSRTVGKPKRRSARGSTGEGVCNARRYVRFFHSHRSLRASNTPRRGLTIGLTTSRSRRSVAGLGVARGQAFLGSCEDWPRPAPSLPLGGGLRSVRARQLSGSCPSVEPVLRRRGRSSGNKPRPRPQARRYGSTTRRAAGDRVARKRNTRAQGVPTLVIHGLDDTLVSRAADNERPH